MSVLQPRDIVAWLEVPTVIAWLILKRRRKSNSDHVAKLLYRAISQAIPLRLDCKPDQSTEAADDAGYGD
ncbi:MAG: hypothetical protein JWM11_484 [Planctomycetaceae bacterium]|nr:hypothetical protein [Planctomycetaceae bacterium]